MSKAFTKESEGGLDNGLDDILRVDDASLPVGEKNYMTPEGAARLRADVERLRALPRGDARQRLNIEARLASLARRLDVLEVIDASEQPDDQVVFGVTVTVRGETGPERSYRIVGVDEADARRGLVSWRTPVARALLGLRVGETATLRTPAGPAGEELEVIRIDRNPPSLGG